MSEEDKQRRRMQAAQKRRQARDLEKQCTIIQGKKAELEAKIEKLEKAKQEITTALTSVSGFSKGDRKDKFDKKVGDVQKVLTTFKKGHKANKSKIDEKIQKLKENLQRVSMSIGTLDVRIGSLDAAAAQLES